MRRIIKQPQTLLHLSDIVSNIKHIVIYDDIEFARFVNVEQCEDVFGGEDINDDDFLYSMTPEGLAHLDLPLIHRITNIQIIEKIAKVDYSKLSDAQKHALKKELSKKVVVDKADVESLLSIIRNCDSVSYEFRHKKTNDFLRDNHGNIRKQDCLDILHNLRVEDYVASTKSFNIGHIGNNLMIFEPDADWELSDGVVLSDLTIYVKLDVDETTHDAIALVSMHGLEYPKDATPYSD